MKLINHSKTQFKTSKGDFKIGLIIDFSEAEAATLLRKKKDGSPVYAGINRVTDLEDKPNAPSKSYDELKAEATELGIDFKGNISKADLEVLIDEAKAAE